MSEVNPVVKKYLKGQFNYTRIHYYAKIVPDLENTKLFGTII